jgi:hypothetical protein
MKNNFTALLLFSALLFSLSSCDNDGLEDTTAKGYILEYGTETAIKDAQVILYKKEAQLSGGYSAPIDTIITDATGYYEFVYTDEAGFFYDIDVRKDTYYDLIYRGLQANQMNEANLFLDPVAALELHIKNVNPFDASDRFVLSQFCEGNYPTFFGEFTDTTITCSIRGNRKNSFTYWVYKDGIDVSNQDSVYCKGHELTKYEIHY